MLDFDVNYVSIVVAAVVSIVAGMIYYSPSVMGKTWMDLKRIKQSDLTSQNRGYMISAVSALITAFFMSNFIMLLGVGTLQEGMEFAFWIWLGFVVTIGAKDLAWGEMSKKLFALDMVYQLISLVLMALVLVQWQ